MGKFILTSFESTLIRILFALYLFFIYPYRFVVSFDQQPYPHGLAQYVNLTIFGDPNVQVLLQVGVLVALVFYILNRFMIVSLVFLLIATIGPVTLLYSQGYVNHGTHIFPLILLGQLLAYLYDLISRNLFHNLTNRRTVDNMVLFFSRQMIATIYIAAGISKLIASHGEWPLQTLNLAPYVIRNFAEDYYAELEPGILERGEWIGRLVIENPEFFVVLFSISLLMELMAFLAVSSRGFALLIGIGLILMHEGIAWTMTTHFRSNEFIIFVFFILPFFTQQIIRRRKLFRISEFTSVTLLSKKTPKFISVLNRIPLKLTWCMVILGLVVGEWYPFSAFPMYKNLSPQTHYYYFTDENKNPISTFREFNLSNPTPTKIMRTRLRYQPATTLAIADESEVGKQFLRYLVKIRKSKERPLYNHLLLWKATISQSGKSLAKGEYLVASVPIP